MEIWLAIVVLATVTFWITSSGLVPPVNAATLVQIRSGNLLVKKGRLRGQAKELVADLLKEAGVTKGYIAILPDKRVTFSRQIPSAIHQRLRNVLLN